MAGRNATPLDFGAGHVNSAGSFDPGLVYDSDFDDWIQFICGTGQLTGADVRPASASIDPSDLNYPSIAVGDLAGKQTVTRTVTNIGNHAAIYQAKVEAPAGFTVTVSPGHADHPEGTVGIVQGDDHPDHGGAGSVDVRIADLGSGGLGDGLTRSAARSRCAAWPSRTGGDQRHRGHRHAALTSRRLHRHPDR